MARLSTPDATTPPSGPGVGRIAARKRSRDVPNRSADRAARSIEGGTRLGHGRGEGSYIQHLYIVLR
jgi:hypothetical protein